MTLESLKDLVRKTKAEFDEFNSVYELDDDLFGTFIERYDNCRPIACEFHGEKEIPRIVPELNVIRLIERGIDEHGFTQKYLQALDTEGADMENATPPERCLAAVKLLLVDELPADGEET